MQKIGQIQEDICGIDCLLWLLITKVNCVRQWPLLKQRKDPLGANAGSVGSTFKYLWCAHKRLPTLRRVSDFSESRIPRSVRWVNDVSSNRTIFLYCSHIHAATSRCPINIQRCIDVPSSDAREIIVRESADSPTMSGRDPSDIYQIINCHYGCR